MSLKPFYEIPFNEWMFRDHPKVREQGAEEKVRQWVLRELVQSYGYPIDWFGIGNLVDIEIPVQMGVDVKYADIAIFTKINERRKPFIFIETKAPGIEEGVSQLHSYLAATITTNIGMWTNSQHIKCFRKQIDPNDIVSHPDIPEYKVREATKLDKGKLIKIVIPADAMDKVKTGILTPISDLEAKLFRCHSILRDEENLHPDEALDEMCKLLYVKMYDEIHTKTDSDYSFQTYIYGNPEQLGASTRALYEEITEKEKQVLQKHGKYDTSKGAFSEPLKIKDSTIWMIVETLQTYSITETSYDTRGRAFEKFLGSTFRGALGQYFTPEPIVRLMIGILDPDEKDMIIDPACGSGRFLTATLRHVKDKVFKHYRSDDSKRIFEDFIRGHLHGIEISKRLIRVAMADMMLFDDGHTNLRATDGLDNFENYSDVQREAFSVVVTNPPFGSSIRDELVLSRFALGQKRKSQDKEILFLNRCIELLQPGGKLGIVLPDGVLANKGANEKTVRGWYREQCKIIAVIALPFHTFLPYGANAKTHVLFLRKWMPGEDINQTYNVYIGEVEDVGYDPAGNVYGKGNVDEIISDFHQKQKWE